MIEENRSGRVVDENRSDRVLIGLQHRFRGLAAAFRSRAFVSKRYQTPERRFRSGLRALYLDARAELDASQYQPFLLWTKVQIESQLGELKHLPIGFDELTGVHDAADCTLATELRWITERILTDLSRVAAQRELALQVEREILLGNLATALGLLRNAEDLLGQSLWGIQLRIAVENLESGLEGQKRYTAEVRAHLSRGLVGFVAYHSSVRNEGKSTYAKFIEDIKARIDRHVHYDAAVKAYLRYRMTGEWPSSEQEWARVLRVEQSHGILDIYETFISALQEVARRDEMTFIRAVARDCLLQIPVDLDFRLGKIAQSLDVESRGERSSPRRSTLLSDALFEGQMKSVLKAFGRLETPARTDPWQLIYAGLALSAHTVRSFSGSSLLQQFPRMIGALCQDDTDASFTQLQKLAANLSGLPTCVALRDFLSQMRPRLDGSWAPWIIGLNSQFIGVEDLRASNKISCQQHGVTIATWMCLLDERVPDRPQNHVATTLTAARSLLLRKYEDAAALLAELLLCDIPECLRSLAIILKLKADVSRGQRQEVIETIATESSRSEGISKSLPIASALSQYSWDDYLATSRPLAAPIALYLLWSLEEKDILMSRLRYAVGRAVRMSGKLKPSEMMVMPPMILKHELVFFLLHACTPPVLDVTRVFKSSKEVLQERQAIYFLLRELDPQNSGDYADAAMVISNQLAMDEGKWIVDRARIHVDTEALSRWARRELFEDYLRYQDLLSVNVENVQPFDEVLKEIYEGALAASLQEKPITEAEAVLRTILVRLGEEFLTNPAFGLDFYLSKRIRHQSFVGRIRGPLEFAGLVSTKDSQTGLYRRNETWVGRFNNCGYDKREEINLHLLELSSNFDTLIQDAKDRKLHLRSPEYPEGLIYINLQSRIVVRIAMSVPGLERDFDDFFSLLVAVLWFALSFSLEDARTYIGSDLKRQVTEELDRCRAAIAKVAANDPELLIFDAAFGEASTNVQRALDEAASWFTHVDVEKLKRTFTLEQAVDIATDNALKSHRSFEPRIQKRVEGDLTVGASSLVLIHDALFVALDNVRAHSELPHPAVQIHVVFSLQDETLAIEVQSDVKPQARALKEKGEDEVRRLIEAGQFGRRTRREGGSGLLKLNAVARQSTRGSLEFGFMDDGRFRLKVVYALILTAREVPP